MFNYSFSIKNSIILFYLVLKVLDVPELFYLIRYENNLKEFYLNPNKILSNYEIFDLVIIFSFLLCKKNIKNQIDSYCCFFMSTKQPLLRNNLASSLFIVYTYYLNYLFDFSLFYKEKLNYSKLNILRSLILAEYFLKKI